MPKFAVERTDILCHNIVTMNLLAIETPQNVSRQLRRRGYGVRTLAKGEALPPPSQVQPDIVLVSGDSLSIAEIKQIHRATLYADLVVLARHITARMAKEAYAVGARAVVPEEAAVTYISGHAFADVRSALPNRVLTEHLVKEFHDAKTGRLDANRVATAFGIPLSTLAKAIDVTPGALSKRPTAAAAQRGLRETEFTWATLRRMLGSDDLVRAWLHAGHPDLGGDPPIRLLTERSARTLSDYLRNALSGQPT